MAPKLMVPTATEIANDGLDNVYPCCARLQIPDSLRDAVATRIGSPGGDFSIYQLTQLTQGERDNTVDNVALEDTADPPQARLPTLFEKAQIRSLFALADQVAGLLYRLLHSRHSLPRQPRGLLSSRRCS